MTASPPGIEIALRPSRSKAALLIGAHGAALLAVWLADLHWLWSLTLSAALAVSMGWALHRHRYDPVTGLAWQAGDWRILLNNRWEPITIKGEALVTPRLILMRYQHTGGRGSLWLTADNTDPEQLRKLRVLLKNA